MCSGAADVEEGKGGVGGVSVDLQDFGGISKLADVAESKDRCNFLAGHHGVDVPTLAATLHVVRNHLRHSKSAGCYLQKKMAYG